jgi:hypothetical protein
MIWWKQFLRKEFNVISLGVPNTWSPKCAHIILIHSAESPVRYLITILLLYVLKLFSWFSKYVWYLIAHICMNSCFHSWNENKTLRNIKIKKYKFVTNNFSNKSTNFKSEINKLNTNKRFQFLENILPTNETSEQNQEGY